jgi:hypothetical protein
MNPLNRQKTQQTDLIDGLQTALSDGMAVCGVACKPRFLSSGNIRLGPSGSADCEKPPSNLREARAIVQWMFDRE